MPTYSFGEDSPLKFDISDKMAERYNQAVEKFFKAQVRFNQKFGRPWNPDTDPIKIKWTRQQRRAWNQFAQVFDRTVKAVGPYHTNDIMDDFLVRNVGSAVARVAKRWGRMVTLTSYSGALTGLLRGL